MIPTMAETKASIQDMYRRLDILDARILDGQWVQISIYGLNYCMGLKCKSRWAGNVPDPGTEDNSE